MKEECKRGGVSAAEILNGSRREKAIAVLTKIAKRSVGELGLSLDDIARHVGVTTSGVAKAVGRAEIKA
jgi:AcrR family transcriptional regulator